MNQILRSCLSLAGLLSTALLSILLTAGCSTPTMSTKAFSVVSGTIDGAKLDPVNVQPGQTLVYNRYSDSLSPDRTIQDTEKTSIITALSAGDVSGAQSVLDAIKSRANDAAGDFINKNRSLNEQLIITSDPAAAVGMSAAFFATRTPKSIYDYTLKANLTYGPPIPPAVTNATPIPPVLPPPTNSVPESENPTSTNAPPEVILAPTLSDVRVTNGTVLFKLENWQEALREKKSSNGKTVVGIMALDGRKFDWLSEDNIKTGRKTLSNLYGDEYHQSIRRGDTVTFEVQTIHGVPVTKAVACTWDTDDT